MSAELAYNFVLPCVSFRPVKASIKFVDRYRRVPNSFALVASALASFILAFITGFLGGVAGMYFYDRAMSKGDDLAIGLGGLFSAGTFTFVVSFTWLQNLHHPISSRTSILAFCASIVLPVLITIASLNDLDDHYLPLVLGDWLAILVLGLLALLVSRRWWHDLEQGF